MHARTVSTGDGVDIQVLEAGAGPALIVLHGFSGAKEDFTEHVDRLSRAHRMVLFDHRGHGESGKPTDTGAYSLARLAADTLEIADGLGIERFRLLGSSMGGMVAQHVVLEVPERVEALVLVNTWPGPFPGATPADARRAGRLALDAGVEVLWRAQSDGDPTSTPAHERLLRERPGHQEFGDRKFLAQSPHMYAALVEELVTRPDLGDDLRSVRCPTLVVVGEEDAAALPGCLALAEAIPGARLARIPDAGHSPQFENPASWAHTVCAFLEGLPG